MILGSSADAVQKHFNCVAEVGKSYGLELNLEKTVLLRIRGDADIFACDGTPLLVKDQAVYLGGLLSINGRPVAELTRRLGEARRSFSNLVAVWKHCNISRSRKFCIYEACVLSKLLYGLESVWLLQADRNRLDSFHAQCLRRILGIPPAFPSRVSNATVVRLV